MDQSTPSTVDRETMWDLNPFPDKAVLSGHIYTATYCSWAVLHLVAPSLYCTCSRIPDNSVQNYILNVKQNEMDGIGRKG